MSMTKEKLRSAYLTCERVVADAAGKDGVTMAIRDAAADTRPRRLSHLLWMAREGLHLVEAERREKAMRWLGFLQGTLWAWDILTVEQLKDMNRPDDSEHDPERA